MNPVSKDGSHPKAEKKWDRCMELATADPPTNESRAITWLMKIVRGQAIQNAALKQTIHADRAHMEMLSTMASQYVQADPEERRGYVDAVNEMLAD